MRSERSGIKADCLGNDVRDPFMQAADDDG